MKTNPVRVNHPMETYASRLIALGLLVGLLLCTFAHGETTNAPAASIAGVYQLASVDAKAVPCSINHGSTAMNVQSGTFTITTNRECFSHMVVSVGSRTNIACDTHATYKLSGSELMMRWQNGGRTKGIVNGNSFTMTNEGMAYVYRK